MKQSFLHLLKATCAVALIALLATNVNPLAAQTNVPAPSPDAAPAPGLFSRVALIGASVTAGYATTNMAGNSRGELCRLNHYFDTAITAPHEPAQNLGSPFFFLSAENSGKSQIESALKTKPTLVVGADFLFWFCYGSGLTEAQRLERFDRGLKLLETIPCPLIVGDIPDCSAATNGILSVSEVPTPVTMQEANQRLRFWAANRPQVFVLNLSSFMQKIRAGQEIFIHGMIIPSDQTGRVLQPDRLHLMPSGCALLTLAALGSMPAAGVEGKVLWNPRDLEQHTVAAINKSWPDLTTTGTVFGPFQAPHRGATLSAVPATFSYSTEVNSDTQGHYSLIWRANLASQAPRPQPLILARDVEHNWAALLKANLSETTLDIHLEPGVALSGKIQTASPLTNALVQASLIADGATSVVSSVTLSLKDQGAFAFRALPQGRAYQISATAPGYGRTTTVLSDEKTRTNTLELPPIMLKTANLPIAGQVLGTDRQPCAGATISVADPDQPYRPSVRSDATGHFLIRDLCEGALTLRVSLAGTNRNAAPLTSVVQARAGDTNIVVNLQNVR